MKFIYKGEFGKAENVLFPGEPGCPVGKPKAFDKEGREIEIPVCEKCGGRKCCIIGQSVFGWICQNPECK